MYDSVRQGVEKAQTGFEENPYVFVYGTLKLNHGNWEHYLKDYSSFLGSFPTKGEYFMHGQTSVPMVFRSSDWSVGEEFFHPVRGEVFELGDWITLLGLDSLEGEGSLYSRQLVEVEGFDTPCWGYLGIPRPSLVPPLSRDLSLNDAGEFEWRSKYAY